jgi:RNA ligase (TIGR02306 family)
MRQLATIRKIAKLEPIKGADKIEVATIDGWKVVVGKGEFKEGDKCIYCEIDSFLPIDPDFEFLRKSSYKQFPDGTEGFRLKTIKLRGQISQGLALTMQSLEGRGYADARNWAIGSDVTEELGIKLYEKPIPFNLAGAVKGTFPREIVPKTDEERVQNIPLDVLTKPRVYYVTEKLDGTSFTAYSYNEHFGVCSRNFELKEDDKNLYWRVAWQYKLPERLPGMNLAVQGEICGPTIQGNPYRLSAPSLYVFGVYDTARGKYLPFEDVELLCRVWGIPRAPFVAIDTFEIQGGYAQRLGSFSSYDEVLVMADGNTLVNFENVPREGLVFKSYSPEYFSFKVISNKYLLHQEENKYEDSLPVTEELGLWQRLKKQMTELYSKIQRAGGRST